MIILLSPFTVSGKWAYLAANRADEDFSDTELAFVIALSRPSSQLFVHTYSRPSPMSRSLRENSRCSSRSRMATPPARSLATSA